VKRRSSAAARSRWVLARLHLGLHRLAGQGEVLRVEPGQQLALAHALAPLHQALDQLAAHPEARLRLDAGPDFAGVFAGVGQAAGATVSSLTARTGSWTGFGLAAGSQQAAGCHDEDKMHSFHGWNFMQAVKQAAEPCGGAQLADLTDN
jgi:hypothetical protein